MSIKDEFKKMQVTTTDPMNIINEVYSWQNGKLVDVGDVIHDVETVAPDPVPSIHVPQAITQPAKLTPVQQLIAAWNGVSDKTKLDFTKKLLAGYLAKPDAREGFKDILRGHGLMVESISMPQEEVLAPEPVASDMSDAPNPKSFRERLEELKGEIEAKKGSGDQDKEEAYDDITSAFDLIAHHLDDIDGHEQMDHEQPEF